MVAGYRNDVCVLGESQLGERKWDGVSVVVAHLIVHSFHKAKEPGVVITYDKVSWDFVFEVLESRGSRRKWIEWIKTILKGGSVGVVINGEESNFLTLVRI